MKPRLFAAALLPLCFATLSAPIDAQTLAPIGALTTAPTPNGIEEVVALAAFFDVTIDAAALQLAWDENKAVENWTRLTGALQKQNVALQARQISFAELQKRGGVALLQLRAPAEFAIAEAFGPDKTLLYQNGSDSVIDNATLQKRYSGHAIVPQVLAAPALQIEGAVRVAPVVSIGGDSEIVQEIPLLNRGTQPLKIEVARTSCGCTGATLDKAVLAPNERGVLTMKMHASDNRLVTVNLNSSDASAPYAIVALQSKLIADIPAPASVLLSARKGETTTAQTVLVLPRGATIAHIQSDTDWLQARVLTAADENALGKYLPGAADAKTQSVPIEVTLKADAPQGRFTHNIALQLGNSELQRIVVPIAGYVANDVTVEPRMLVLGTIAPGETLRKTVVVQGPQGQKFSIRSTQSSSDQLKIIAPPDVTANAHAVQIDITPRNAGALQERATLTLSDQRTLDIDIMGEVSAQAASTVAPTLRVGQAAPDFTITDANGTVRRLSDLRGQQNLLLTFFPRCFTGGCAGQLASLQRELPNFARANTQIWAVSVDGADGTKGQRAFAHDLKLTFPLLPDTQRAITTLYGATKTPDDLAARQSVLIDKNGIVRWIDTDVKVQTHGADVLAKMQQLDLIP